MFFYFRFFGGVVTVAAVFCLFFICDIFSLSLFFLNCFLVHTINQPLQKTNMMYLKKEATNKDQSLKMQMLLSIDNSNKTPSEKI